MRRLLLLALLWPLVAPTGAWAGEAAPQDAAKVTGLKERAASGGTLKPVDPGTVSTRVKMCPGRSPERERFSDGCQSAKSGDGIARGDSLVLLLDSWARLSITLSDGSSGRVVLLPEVGDERGEVISDVPLGSSVTALYKLRGTTASPRLHVERGALIAKNWTRARTSGFRVTAAGREAEPAGTSWALTVDFEGNATLRVDEDSMRVYPIVEGSSYGAAAPLLVRAGEKLTWSPGVSPTASVKMSPTEVAVWHAAIAYNGEKIWEGGGFPFIVIPIAATVPMVVCALVPDCLRSNPEPGNTGNVGVRVPTQ